jgi:phage/plasmid-associated DNA primase
MTDTKNAIEIDFSDSDSEECDDPIKNEVSYRVQENTECIYRAFKVFLSEPSYINNKGDNSTNIVDRYLKKCYNIPDKKISKFFKYLDACRNKKLRYMLYEKQLNQSGIMLDFDIKQKDNKSYISHTQYHRLCIEVSKILLQYVEFNTTENLTNDKLEIYVGFIRKPKIIHIQDGNYYKDGLHMIIPGIKITREFKKHIIMTLIENNIMDKIFKDVTPSDCCTNGRSDFMDINSAHVGVHFIGSATKMDKPPYELDGVYKIQMSSNDDIIPIRANELIDIPSFNACYEFSLNWEKPSAKGGIIIKKQYDIKKCYLSILDQYKSTKKEVMDFDDDNDKNYNDMSILNIHDSDSQYIKSLLDILHIKRCEDYSLWFDVICSLAHTSKSYKPLAEYFSLKCPEKYNQSEFDKIWSSIISKKENNLSLGSIHYWAKIDNPDRYEEVRHRCIYNMLYKKLYDAQTEGYLEHYDIAEILYRNLKNKYIYDIDESGGTWYEFILENEPQKLGEMYKFRKYTYKPSSFLRYISAILPNLFKKILDRIKNTIDESSGELAKYHYQIYKNFQKSCRNLKNSAFKRSIITEAEQLFEQIGFNEKLDADPILKGVGNGILKLGEHPKLITGFHGYYVSKFTPVGYYGYDPRNANIKKVLVGLRNLFPDGEPDTFDYIMHYLASTLDGKKKESIMLLLVGKGSNGKSFLVELHKGAIGASYGVKMPISFLTSRSKDAESATPALMMLMHAHFAYYSESNRCEVLNAAKIKEFTGQETLSGRKLHQDYINFKPKCHHLVTSNNDFEVPSTDHGTWRRLQYCCMKMKFCNLATDTYDPNNPYERVADPALGSDWAEDNDILSAYLSILVYYYVSLQTKYAGKVQNVPHPHIIKETEDFRNRQDKINNFIHIHLVKCSDVDFETSISTVVEKYNIWYNKNNPGEKGLRQGTVADFENSSMQIFLRKTKRDTFLKGYRIKDQSDDLEDGEEFYTDICNKSNNKNADIANVSSESAYQLHDRLCDEYIKKDLHKIFSIDECVDHDISPIVKSNDTQYIPKTNTHPLLPKKIDDLSGDDSDITSDIIKIKKTEPVKYNTKLKVETQKISKSRIGNAFKKNAKYYLDDDIELSDSDTESQSDVEYVENE